MLHCFSSTVVYFQDPSPFDLVQNETQQSILECQRAVIDEFGALTPQGARSQRGKRRFGRS